MDSEKKQQPLFFSCTYYTFYTCSFQCVQYSVFCITNSLCGSSAKFIHTYANIQSHTHSLTPAMYYVFENTHYASAYRVWALSAWA